MEQSKKDRQLECSRNWKKNNAERHAELARAYRARNKEKTKAQNLLNYAVRTGNIERKPCEACGTTERVHGHHHDYSKPYDVRWFCFACHKAEHPVTEQDKAVKFEGAKHAAAFGTTNPNAKITDEDVTHIHACLALGISQTKIAKAFGIHQGSVSKIKLGKTWAHTKQGTQK